MKQFFLKAKSTSEINDVYEWCTENIGTENVLWWDAKKMVRDAYYRTMEIWIEDDDQATMFALVWGHLAECEA